MHVEQARARFLVVPLVINEYEQRIAEAVDFLAGPLERARRLGLPDARNLDVHSQYREVNALRGIPPFVVVAVLEVGLKLVFQVCANGFAIGDTKKSRLRML